MSMLGYLGELIWLFYFVELLTIDLFASRVVYRFSSNMGALIGSFTMFSSADATSVIPLEQYSLGVVDAITTLPF